MQTKLKHHSRSAFTKALLYLLIAMGLFSIGSVFAAEQMDIGQIAKGVSSSFAGIAQLMIAIAYVAGIGFVLASIFKFKQHKDNPTQIPLGTPLALLVIGIVLIFLPMIFGPIGQSIFGANPTAGGFGGEGFKQIPGSQGGTGQ